MPRTVSLASLQLARCAAIQMQSSYCVRLRTLAYPLVLVALHLPWHSMQLPSFRVCKGLVRFRLCSKCTPFATAQAPVVTRSEFVLWQYLSSVSCLLQPTLRAHEYVRTSVGFR